MRKAWFVDQSVSSKARRAPSIARCISAVEPSATWPMTSSVAGLTLSKVLPESASTSLPSINILCSGLTFTVSVTVRFLSSSGSTQVTTAGNARQRHADSCLGSLSSGGYLTLTSPSKMTV